MWIILFDQDFAEEFAAFDQEVRDAILAYAKALAQEGPLLGRPYADTLKGSVFRNMKELRPTVNKVEWRVAFAFDPIQRGILLCAAAKGGKKNTLVYARLIATADRRFEAHLANLKRDPESLPRRRTRAKQKTSRKD